jgi:16S rRNA (guanine1207-N2)-methyltransferase
VRSNFVNHIVLIKLPKSLAMLEDQLHRIRPLLDVQTTIIAAAMTKNVHNSTLELFEKIIGPTTSSRAQKKSRLIFSEVDPALNVADNPYPKSYALPYKLDDVTIEVKNHAAVFSQERLDLGSRFFIENIPVDEKYKTIVDLGCGNGVLGLLAAIKNPAAKIIFTDESYMAVESSISNFLSVFEDSREAEFLQTDCLQGIEENSVSLILCNPPFHQNNAINDDVAWQMFSESKSALEKQGELWVIGNRHLAYHAKLKKIFGNADVVVSNKKFVIVKAVKK